MIVHRRGSQLALHATLILALEPQGIPRRVSELAEEMGVPRTYLAKVLQGLARAGLLRTVRGPGGGVCLARSPREIRPWDVLSAMEPVRELDQCFLGLGQCNDAQACPLHQAWGPIRTALLEMLQSHTLWEFASEAEHKGLLPGRVSAVPGNSGSSNLRAEASRPREKRLP